MLFGWLLLLWWRHVSDNGSSDLRRRWQQFTNRFRKQPRLDSSADKDYSDYHYQRRV